MIIALMVVLSIFGLAGPQERPRPDRDRAKAPSPAKVDKYDRAPSQKAPASSHGDVVTAYGAKADRNGNKLGPSGKAQVNNVDHSTRKRANDAARNAGKAAPEQHPNPVKGDPHFHPTDRAGNKLPGSTHHTYPK